MEMMRFGYGNVDGKAANIALFYTAIIERLKIRRDEIVNEYFSVQLS